MPPGNASDENQDRLLQAEFQPADAVALPFPEVVFRAVVCQFGVMFFPDKEKSYREVRQSDEPYLLQSQRREQDQGRDRNIRVSSPQNSPIDRWS